MIKKQIPNLFTLLNLLSGIIAVMVALSGRLVLASFFVFLGIFFDFFDGFFARKFKVEGELGKQLDSLADMVTSGVAPGIVMFQLLLFATQEQYFMSLMQSGQIENNLLIFLIPSIGLIIPLASAYRLANFNIDERQTSSFIGLPTPALSILVVSLPLIIYHSDQLFFMRLARNSSFLIFITLLGSYLLNAEIPLFSLKFKNYGWTDNTIKYIFLIAVTLLLLTFQTVAIPLIILLYVLLSVIENILKKNKVAP